MKKNIKSLSIRTILVALSVFCLLLFFARKTQIRDKASKKEIQCRNIKKREDSATHKIDETSQQSKSFFESGTYQSCTSIHSVDKKKRKSEEKLLRAQQRQQARIERRQARKLRKRAQKCQDLARWRDVCCTLERQEKERLNAQIERLKLERQEQEAGMKRWETVRKNKIAQDYKDGCYAYLDASPYEWPFACTYFSKKDVAEVYWDYQYASDAYNSDGSSVGVAALALGDGPVHLRDILLASKLVNSNILTYKGSPELQAGISLAAKANSTGLLNEAIAAILACPDADAPAVASAITGAGTAAVAASESVGSLATNAAAAVLAGNYIDTLADQVINFKGNTRTISTCIDFARYIWDKKVLFGLQVPIVYQKNTLSCDFPYIKEVLAAKGIDQLGGSTTGLGDVALFTNVDIGTRTFKKIISGVKITFPTGKKAATSSLWAPKLGCGYTQFTAYTGLLMRHNRFINPHVYIDGTYSMPAYFNRRVPVLVTGTVNNDKNLVITEQDKNTKPIEPNKTLNNNLMSMGNRLEVPTSVVPFSSFDSAVSAFADNVFSVKVIPGLKFNVTVGNIIEKVILRQGFFGFGYNFQAKFSDAARGLDIKNYDLDALSSNTAMIAHKVSANYSYEFDSRTFFGFGIEYTFAGINTPKNFDLSALLSYSF